MALLYLSSVLPKRSETFVYNEVLGLRRLGIAVHVASLYLPERNLDDSLLASLADEAITVYAQGFPLLIRDALSFISHHLRRSLSLLSTATGDAIFSRDLKIWDRLKIPIQALAALALAWRVRDHQLTGIHVHMAHAPTTIGMYLARALAIPMSFTGHAVDLFRDRSMLAKKLHRASFVACISNWHRDWYRSLVAGDERKYPLVRCGVTVPEMGSLPTTSHHLRILGLARLVPKKGFDTLLDALAIAQQSNISFTCTLAGDGPEMSTLTDRSRTLGLSERINFLGEFLTPEFHYYCVNQM